MNRSITLFRTLALSGMALAGAGCMVGPHYQAPSPAPVALIAPGWPVLVSGPAPTSWWRLFDDPVLDNLVGRSAVGNLDLRQAVARVGAARALFDDAKLDRLPRVTSEAGYARSRSQRPGQTEDQVTLEQADLGFDATWELDLFGHVGHQIHAAKADADAAQFDADDVRVLVTAEVVRNYLILRGAQARQTVAERNTKTQEDTLRLTRIKVEVGQGDPVDVQIARARLEATKATIPALAIAESQAGFRLAVLLGLRPGALDDQLRSSNGPLLRPAVTALPLGDVSDLLRRRPDMRAAERRLAAQTARVGVATADLFPRVRVSGFVGLLSGDVSDLFKSGAGAYSVAPSVTWPALDLGGARARLRAQQAGADASLAAYDQAALRAIEDLQGSIVAYGQRQRQIASLVEQMDASRRAAQLAKIRYREGDMDFLRLLEADRAQLDAEDALTRAEVEANTDVVAIYKALGGA